MDSAQTRAEISTAGRNIKAKLNKIRIEMGPACTTHPEWWTLNRALVEACKKHAAATK